MLRPHTHEDLPYRWFQLLVEANEIYAVDLILEEFEVHGANSAFHPDLAALAELLQQANDPETEDKMLQFLNTADAPRSVIGLIEDVLERGGPRPHCRPNPMYGSGSLTCAPQTGSTSPRQSCLTPGKRRKLCNRLTSF